MHINSSNHFKINKYTNENNDLTKKSTFLTAAKKLTLTQIVKHTLKLVNKLPKS
jgi:hypothetical protein